MDTTTDYKALYLKKFFQWQEICGKQRAQIEELEKKLKIAIKALKWIEEQADTSTQYDYDAEVILKNILFDAQQTLKEIEE